VFVLSYVRILATVFCVASTAHALTLENFIDGCPLVKRAKVLIKESKQKQLYYSLLPWEEFLPRIRATYARRQLVAGPANNFNLGFQGTVANPVKLYSLVSSGNAQGLQNVETSRADLTRARRDWIKRYFEWQYSQTISQLAKSESTLLGFSTVKSDSPTTSSIELISDAASLVLEITQARTRESELRRRLLECAAEPGEVTLEVPEPETFSQKARLLAKNIPEIKACEAEFEKDKYLQQSIKWAWLPDLVYSFSQATPLLDNTFIFSEWFVGAQMTIPLASLAAVTPSVSSCEIRAASVADQFRDLATRSQASLGSIATLNKLASQMELVVRVIDRPSMQPSVSPDRYVSVIKEYVRIRQTLRDTLVPIQQIWLTPEVVE
jgi:hypothetical protein